MGRRSPSSKREKRFKQKVKRKLFAREQGDSTKDSCLAEGRISNSHSDTDEVTQTTDSCLGEDMDVVLMQMEDSLIELESDERQAEYSYEYLLECRQKLMHKVTEYRARIEE